MRPRSEYEGKFSLQYSVASLLVRGHVAVADFTEEAISDPAVLAADLPESGDVLGRPTSWQIFESDTGVYEALLQASMVLFNAKKALPPPLS